MGMLTGSARQVSAEKGIACVLYKSLRKRCNYINYFAEEVILAEERTTEDERFHIMDARRRAAAKRKKMKSLGQGSSIEDDEEEDEPDEDGKSYNFSLSLEFLYFELSAGLARSNSRKKGNNRRGGGWKSFWQVEKQIR